MILILGSSHDDVLYYETMMTAKRKEILFDRYPVIFGKLFNQEVAVVSEIYTNYISSIVTSYFIDKFFVILVVCVGTCIGYSSDSLPLSVAISGKVTLSDVNQLAVRPVSIGQIPNGFPTYFDSDSDARDILFASFAKRTQTPCFLATYFSSNTFYTREEQLEPLKNYGKLTSLDSGVVFDCIYGGVALACNMNSVSCLAVKVVESSFGKAIDCQDYSKILTLYVDIGKALSGAIGDIGSGDILEGV